MISRWAFMTKTFATAMVAGAFGGALTVSSVTAEDGPAAGIGNGSVPVRVAQAKTRAVKTIEPVEPEQDAKKDETAEQPAPAVAQQGERQIEVERKAPDAPAGEKPPRKQESTESTAPERKQEDKPEAAAGVKKELAPEDKATPKAETSVEQPKKPAQPEQEAASAPTSGPELEQAALQVLDKHCARCHQEGKLNGRKPAKNFGNVLKLEEIARDTNLIQPGNPDASRLYIQIAKQEMPYDVYQEFSGGAEPTEDELKVLRDWIGSLGKAITAACEARKFVTNNDMLNAISADLERERDILQKGMRYITLTHLYNACASDKEMEVYRQGVVKLLNSLSQNEKVVRLQTVDEAGTILKFHLDDLKWTSKQWNKLIAAYPYAVKPDYELYEDVKAKTDTPLAMVRGDWFAFAASRPPLYHDLLGLPKTLQELEKQLGLNILENIENNLVKRAGFQVSGVSRNNRLIERHEIPNGVFWTSYDFAGNKGRQSLLEHPLGPKGKNAFTPDGGETIFTLPNGFNGYYLNTETGKRLDTGPTEIVLDPSSRDQKVTNGISCFGCHNQGFRKATDDVRKHVLADKTFPKEVREKVEAIYTEPEEMTKLIESDSNRFRSAMREAGLDPDLDLNGVEMINALAKRFEGDIGLRQAAAEYGLTEKEFKLNLGAAGNAFFRFKRRLEQGVVPRDTFEGRFPKTVAKVTDDEALDLRKLATKATKKVAKVGGKSKEQKRDFELSLVSNKSVYKQNDLAVFTVKSAAKCHLTLINVDGKGNGTVIFPNKFQKNNLIAKDQLVKFPAARAPFQFRLKDKGTETVIAVCNATGKKVDTISHDFKTRGFTKLGNYRDFVTRAIVVEGKKKVAAASKKKKVAEKKKKKSRKKKKAKTKILARTAIKFKVD